MKIRNVAFLVVALGVSCGLIAQTSSPETRVVRAPKNIEKRIIVRTGEPGMHGEMGKWWRDTEISKKLQLSEGQIQQLDQIFYDHRVKLIDHGAEMEKQDLKLQSLLEREYTFMNLDLRKVLSLDQWRQLKAVRSERGGDNVIYFHRKLEGPGAGPMLPPPPPDSEGEVSIPNL